jgi:hypothetical protein
VKDYRKLALALGATNCVLYVFFPDFRHYINNFSEVPFFLDLIGLFFIGFAWGISWGVAFVPGAASDPEARDTLRSMLFWLPASVAGKPIRIMAGVILLFLSALHTYWFYDAFFGG